MLRDRATAPAPARQSSWVPSVACLGLAVIVAACSAPAPQKGTTAETAVDVTIAKATVQPLTRLLHVTGTLMADEEAEVAAETAGRVVETPVERGTAVANGAPLIRLAPTEAEASLQEAEANVAQVEVRLSLTADQPFDVERVAEVSNARARHGACRGGVRPHPHAYDEHVVSGSEFDQRRTQVEVTQRQYDTARNNARQLYRSLEAARARLTLARKALADTVVRAPFAGLVVERQVSIGDFVTRGTKVVTVVRINPLRLQLTVPEQSAVLGPRGPTARIGGRRVSRPTVRGPRSVHFAGAARRPARADRRGNRAERGRRAEAGPLRDGRHRTAKPRERRVRARDRRSATSRATCGCTWSRATASKNGWSPWGRPAGEWVEIVNGLVRWRPGGCQQPGQAGRRRQGPLRVPGRATRLEARRAGARSIGAGRCNGLLRCAFAVRFLRPC